MEVETELEMVFDGVSVPLVGVGERLTGRLFRLIYVHSASKKTPMQDVRRWLAAPQRLASSETYRGCLRITF